MNCKAIIDEFNQVSLHDPSKEIIEKYLHIEEIKELDPFGNPMVRPLFSHSSIPYVLDIETVKLEEFNFDTNSIYSVMLHHNAELAVEHLNLIPKTIIDKLKQYKCKLILDNTLEGDTIERLLPILYSSLDKLKIPYSQVFLVTNNLVAREYYYKWIDLAKHFISPFDLSNFTETFFNKIFAEDFKHNSVNIISFPWNIHDVKRLIHSGDLPEVVDIEKEIEYKTKHLSQLRPFLKVNRTGRPERSFFMLYANYHKLLDKFRISFPRLEHLNDFESAIIDKYPEIISKSNIDSLQKKVPFDIDVSDINNHGQPGTGIGKFNADLPFNPQHYRDTFISVVMCAFPYIDNACHLHSSTFNPIYCGHAYLGYGPHHHLQELKRLGFKTFNKWWDESYDNLPNHFNRLEKVLNIVEDISKYSNSDLLQMYKEMKNILQHNSNLIKNYDGREELRQQILFKGRLL